MRLQLMLVGGLAFCLATVWFEGRSTAEQPKKPTQTRSYSLDFSLREGDPSGSLAEGTVKVVLSHPPVMASTEKEVDCFIGSQTRLGTRTIDVGIGVKCFLAPKPDQKVHVDAVFAMSTFRELEPDAFERQTTELIFAKDVECNQPVRIPLPAKGGVKRWLEVVVQEYES
jgi:hypothetical protein